MSEHNENNDPFDFEFENESDEQKEVLDEEGTVDRKVKDRILKSREMVDQAETELFIRKYEDMRNSLPRGASHEDVESALADRWAVVVKQYIRTVRPLFVSDEIEGASEYWEEIPIVDEMVYPSPQKGVDWRRFYTSDQDDYTVASSMEMNVEPAFEAPEPKRVTLNGLKMLEEFESKRLTWTVVLTPSKFGKARKTMSLEDHFTLTKPVYEKAVELTDEFLQQAGIGLQISAGDPHGKT